MSSQPTRFCLLQPKNRFHLRKGGPSKWGRSPDCILPTVNSRQDGGLQSYQLPAGLKGLRWLRNSDFVAGSAVPPPRNTFIQGWYLESRPRNRSRPLSILRCIHQNRCLFFVVRRGGDVVAIEFRRPE